MNRPISVATVPTKDTAKHRQTATTWRGVLDGVRSPIVGPDKEAGGLVFYGLLDSTRLRRGRHLVSRSLLTLDADHLAHGDDLADRVRALGCAAVVYPTHSHTSDAPRFRVLVLPDRDLTPGEYPVALAALEVRLGLAFDPAMRSAVQAIFAPATADSSEYRRRLAVFDGPPVAVGDLLFEADALGLQIESQGLADVPPYDGPDFDSLPAQEQEAARAHVEHTMSLWRGRLADAAGWPEGATDEQGRGWDTLARDAAIALARTAAHPAYPLDVTDAETAYRELVEPFGSAVADKWNRAVAKAHGEPPTEPTWPSTPADDFDPVQDDSDPVRVTGSAFDALVERELVRLRARHRAAELFRVEQRPELPPFDAGTLAEHLLKPEPPPARVDGLIPWDASTAVVAQRKAGKTTFTLNLAHALLTGEPFLGQMDVRPVDGKVALLNYEVSGHTVARWAHEVGIPTDRLFVVNLRGASNPFADAARLADLAAMLRRHEVESVIVDPFGRAFPGDSQNDAGQVQGWLVALDAFARETVGARDVVLTVHAGWNGERARGSSALEDWGDALVYLTRDDETEQRFIRAVGRDVELPEDLLLFDPETRALALAGVGSRTAARAMRNLDDLTDQVLAVVAANPGVNGTRVGELLNEAGVPQQRNAHRKALADAVAKGLLRVTHGPRGAKCYNLPGTEPGDTTKEETA